MTRDIYNWDTSHDTVGKTMIHHFVAGVELIVDWGNRQMALLDKNYLIGQLTFPESYTVRDHTEVTFRISEIANAPREKFRRARLKKIYHELCRM